MRCRVPAGHVDSQPLTSVAAHELNIERKAEAARGSGAIDTSGERGRNVHISRVIERERIEPVAGGRETRYSNVTIGDRCGS